jgi:hypothetical protein
MKQLMQFLTGALLWALVGCGGDGLPLDEKVDGYWDEATEEFVPPGDELGVAEQAITVRSGFGINDQGFSSPKGPCNIVTPVASNNCFYPSSKSVFVYLPSGTLPGLTASESTAFKNAITGMDAQLNTAVSGTGFSFTFTNNPNPGGVVVAPSFFPGTGANPGSGMRRYAQVACVAGGQTIVETIPGVYRLCTGFGTNIFLHDAFTDFGAVGSAGWNRHAQHVLGYIATASAGIGSVNSTTFWNSDVASGATFTGISASVRSGCLGTYNLAGGVSSLIRNGSCS